MKQKSGHTSNRYKDGAARAREARARQSLLTRSRTSDLPTETPDTDDEIQEIAKPSSPQVIAISDSESDDELREDCQWDGTINHWPYNSDSESDWTDDEVESDSNSGSDTEDSELEGDELLESLEKEMMDEINKELKVLSENGQTMYERVTQTHTSLDWSKAEKNRHLGYSKNSARTKHRNNTNARHKEEGDRESRNSKSAALMRSFFIPVPDVGRAATAQPLHRMQGPSTDPASSNASSELGSRGAMDEVFLGYLSDMSEDIDLDEDRTIEEHAVPEHVNGWETDEFERDEGPLTSAEATVTRASMSNAADPQSLHFRVRPPPPLKRRKLDVPARVVCRNACDTRKAEFKSAFRDIEKLVASKRDVFAAGRNGLQAYRARAIQTCLQIIVKRGRLFVDASQRAAESQGFAEKWGGRLVRQWVRNWIKMRELPTSRRGCNVKSFSLLEDPAIQAELRSFVRSNKWSMDPGKLAKFSERKMVPEEAKKYSQHLAHDEIPRGLKHYLEVELFPRVHYKAKRGISLRTARRWLRSEGFQYTEHKKALYYDGHERPDVVEYRQNVFLPTMAEFQEKMAKYVVGDVETPCIPQNLVERPIVLCAHDEMTVQANDGAKKSWVFQGEFRLKKKGQGRGIHCSDVICSTVGWLEKASQTLEYGKNYDGYWTGELFVKQLKEKIIPAFEEAHGPGYRALIMVDNSQGHSVYPEDALLASRMNMKPGGKQARMRNGWYRCGDEIISQKMIFPLDHPEFPDMPKGMKQVLEERGLWRDKLRMQCKKCDVGISTCCAKSILQHQDDFQEQRSMVQEIIEEAGHLCIFLPKFHCELNFIEFFWAAVKRLLRENCDCTFQTLQENLLKALAAIDIHTIRRWEHRMVRWMDAYRSGLGAKEAQFQVKQFSSRKYTSHRRVPETLARQFDAD